MIDFHSHILPHFDDGAANTEISLAMIEESRRQGIDILYSTSHFYPSQESPEHFLERRQAAFDRLKQFIPADAPEIKLGAEVQYFEGITKVKKVADLKLQDSSLLLLEMPFSGWSRRMVEDVLELNSRPDTTVLLAHVERYMQFNKDDVFLYLHDHGVLIQSNASYFLKFFDRMKALKWLDKGIIQVLGSDSHNMDERKPQLNEAFKVIEKKLGANKLKEMDEFAHSLIHSKG